MIGCVGIRIQNLTFWAFKLPAIFRLGNTVTLCNIKRYRRIHSEKSFFHPSHSFFSPWRQSVLSVFLCSLPGMLCAFIHSPVLWSKKLIQQIFFEYLVYARYYAKLWGKTVNKTSKNPCIYGIWILYILPLFKNIMRANIHSILTLFFFTYYILKFHPYHYIKTVLAYRDLFFCSMLISCYMNILSFI